MNYFQNNDGTPRVGRMVATVAAVVAGFIGLIVILSSFGTVNAGYRGVLLTNNAVTGEKGEGLYFKIPFIQSVVELDARETKEEVDASAASKDLQTVNTKVAVNYRLKQDRVLDLYQNVGIEYKEKLIAPAIQESVKAATARYTAEELITKRDEVRDVIFTQLKEKLATSPIEVKSFSIINFAFSQSFDAAIEAKVTAEQEALTSKNQLETAKYDADKRIAEARGEAEAIRIQAQAITSQGGEDYVKLKAIEKWNGQYPTTVLGSATPIINI